MITRRIPKREKNESADHFTTRILSEVVLMNPEEIKQTLLDVWSDGYWNGHGSAREELGEKPLIN